MPLPEKNIYHARAIVADIVNNPVVTKATEGNCFAVEQNHELRACQASDPSTKHSCHLCIMLGGHSFVNHHGIFACIVWLKCTTFTDQSINFI